MTARLTTPTWVTFNGEKFYYVSSIEDGYYDEDADGEWVAPQITLKEEYGRATITLSADCAEWANARVFTPETYADVRAG